MFQSRTFITLVVSMVVPIFCHYYNLFTKFNCKDLLNSVKCYVVG